MRENWTGFYGPAYRLLLQHAEREEPSDAVWQQIVAFQQDNPPLEGHWEFLALGYALLFDRTEELSATARLRLSWLKNQFQATHATANWRLMARLVNRRLDRGRLCFADLGKVDLVPEETGFLPDLAGDNSTQYHAFLLFLIMRFGDVQDKDLTQCVAAGLTWLTDCHAKFGDPSPLGRGRFQIFGYAAMAGLATLAKDWGQQLSPDWCATVWHRLHARAPCGALSAHWDGPHRRHLLHGYNTVEDYPAFAALLTHGIVPPSEVPPPETSLWWHVLDEEGSGLIADQNGARLAVLMAPPPMGSTGMRQAMRQLLTRKSAHEPRPEKIADPLFLCGGWAKLYHVANETRFTLDTTLKLSPFLATELTLWSPTPARNVTAVGSAEMAEMTWQQAGGAIWHGHTLRLVRGGKISVAWGRDD